MDLCKTVVQVLAEYQPAHLPVLVQTPDKPLITFKEIAV